MDKFEKKMKDAGLSQAAIAAFRMNYDQLAGGATGLVSHVVVWQLSERFAQQS